MRILLYNFLQPEESGAGGVGVYLGNLVKALIGHGHQVITMSAGDRYSIATRKPKAVFKRDSHDRMIVLNSPVVAPASYSFAHPEIYLDESVLDHLPEEIEARYGDIDVFHFHNLEGLTQSFFLRLRDRFPKAKILFSVHNYNAMCSRVTLWYQNRVACQDYREGAACTVCFDSVYDLNRVKNGRRLSGVKKAFPGPAKFAAKTLRSLRTGPGGARSQGISAENEAQTEPTPSLAKAANYARFRHANIRLFETVFDHVLSVSRRTRQVLIDRGAHGDRISVSYIGTAHYEAALTSHKISDIGSSLNLGYIGYMTADKGFFFLLDCLERIPAEVAGMMTVTIAARNTDVEGHARVMSLASRFQRLRYFDGYTHDTLDEVLDGVNLGLIPVLWEDNLPQTAIELVSRGIPILTSDRGGAQEIADNPTFIFRAGDHGDLVDRICRISRRDVDLADFWAGDMRIVSMDEHVADLMRYYAP